MKYQHIDVQRITPTIGALVSGVDLNAVKSAAVYEEIRQALWDNKVIFFRKQALTPQAHLALGRVFGDMEKHEFFPHVEGAAEIQIISNTGRKSPDTDRWHADCTFREKPNAVSILRAVDIPPEGGDTMWACMHSAFEALDEPMKNMLLQLDAEHDISHAFRRMGYTGEARQLDASNPPYIHPAVINHPITGKLTLFVNSVWTKRFTNLTDRYGENLLRLLNEWVSKPEFQVRFRWEPDSVAIWDNLATQHYAVFDYAGQARTMNRVTCEPTRVRLDARPQASRPAPIERFGHAPSMMAAMRPEMSSGMAASPTVAKGAGPLLDEDQLRALPEPERRAVRAVFEAIASLDLDEIARRGARM
ncbi:TauD/TfdA family dioxygenase [Hydrogenophaga sp.]|uniref:TauD/TfdA dioxygenase family protein n=1 Tax=Hydrogenophaga sp. TaxID=1904254 RepID=UPI002CC2CCD4|nr:TauD/TfdA family dioxygenase [Hydrogenophaga sp.]HMP09498.1 TauD/TfdA family dioxygenase [Hydrogenophaga sp.]